MKLSEFAKTIPIPTGSTPMVVVEVLREAIVAGFFKAGAPLRQDLIAAELGTSKIPVREALRQLEAEGLVKFAPNKGAVVSEMSLPEVVELFELRVLLECEAIALAIPHLTPEVLHQAETIIEEAETEMDVRRWGELNWQFHSVLYQPANRPYLLSIVEKIHTHSDRYVRLHLSLTKSQARSQLEHYAILDACKRSDITTAISLLTAHLQLAKFLLLEYFKNCDF